MSEEIKIWKVGECDWIAARTAEGAAKCLFEMVEGPGEVTPEFRKEYLDDEDPVSLSPSEMDTLTVQMDEDDPSTKISFRQALELMKGDGTEFPSHFATSEY